MDSQVRLIQQAITVIESFEGRPTAALVDAYRLLRNSVATDEKLAEFIFTNGNCEKLISKTVQLINSAEEISRDKDDNEICINFNRCSIQFVGNFAGRMERAKIYIFHDFRQLLANVLLSHEDSKLRNYANFLFFNCLNVDVMNEFCSSTNVDEFSYSQLILSKLFESVKSEADTSEWSLFALQRFITDCDLFTKSFWSVMSTENRIVLTEICISLIEENHSARGDKPLLHPCNVISLIEPFVEISSGVVPEIGDFDENRFHMQIRLLGPMLTVFCKITDASFQCYEVVRCNAALLRSTLTLLRRMQIRCRAGHPFFTVGKLSVPADGNDEAFDQHPAFNVKRSLVNLTANLCYRLPEQQALAGQLDAVSLIMDCTEMDSKNRFITQWAVLALRNLLENCPENQRVVAEMHAQGVVNNSDILNDLHLEPYLDDDERLKFTQSIRH